MGHQGFATIFIFDDYSLLNECYGSKSNVLQQSTKIIQDGMSMATDRC